MQKYRIARNVKLGEETQLAGTIVEMDPAEAAKHPDIFVSVEAEQAEAQRESERLAAEAPKRLLTHLELREQLRADEADRMAADARVLKTAAEQHGKIAAEADRQAAISAAQVDRTALSVVRAEKPAPAQPAPAQQDLPPHKRHRKE